jgi:hypothetical protein
LRRPDDGRHAYGGGYGFLKTLKAAIFAPSDSGEMVVVWL